MSDTPPSPPAPKSRKPLLRTGLLILGPLLAIVAGLYIYLSGGRYVSTDNAYLHADKLAVSAEVSGRIESILVDENQRVEKGDLLFEIDDQVFRMGVARSEAELKAVRSAIAVSQAKYRQKLAEMEVAKETAAYTEREYRRQLRLAETSVASESKLERAEHDWHVATRQIAVIEQEISELMAELDGDPDLSAEQRPRYIEARVARDGALLFLKRTQVRAPFAGIVAKTPKRGQYVAAGAPVLSLIANRDFWIDANLKETDLTHVRPGQPVSIHIDTYPDREWSGTVESISQGSGAEFSVLPPQNASGNWVKVTQRVPVRIAITTEPSDPPLRAGLSAEVTIDTGHKRSLFDRADKRSGDTTDIAEAP